MEGTAKAVVVVSLAALYLILGAVIAVQARHPRALLYYGAGLPAAVAFIHAIVTLAFTD